MAAANKRLAGPAQLTNTAATKYTTPTGGNTIVRKIHLFNADTSARTVTISIGIDGAATRILDAYSIPAGSPYDLWGPYNLASTEIIQANADVASKVTMTVDGTEYTIP